MLSALWTGAAAAVVGAALGVGVCVVSWLPSAGVSGHPLSAARVGIFAFLAGLHGGTHVNGASVALTPLGITVVVGGLAWRASSALGEAAVRLRRTSAGTLVIAWLTQTAGFSTACVILTGIGRLGTTSASPAPAAIAGGALFGVVAGLGLCRHGELRTAVARMSPVLRDGLRAALGAATAYVGLGALLVAASLVVHADVVTHLSRLVGGGLAGEPIALLGVFTAPNAAIAGAAYLAGPGFTLGAGTHVSAFQTSHGVLPAFPLLGAVPSGAGQHGIVLAAMVGTAVLAGAVVARACAVGSLAAASRRLAVAIAATALTLAALGWLAGGGIGAGRLHVVGPSPWRLGLAVALEVGVVAVVLLLAWSLCRTLLGRDSAREDLAGSELVDAER